MADYSLSALLGSIAAGGRRLYDQMNPWYKLSEQGVKDYQAATRATLEGIEGPDLTWGGVEGPAAWRVPLGIMEAIPSGVAAGIQEGQRALETAATRAMLPSEYEQYMPEPLTPRGWGLTPEGVERYRRETTATLGGIKGDALSFDPTLRDVAGKGFGDTARDAIKETAAAGLTAAGWSPKYDVSRTGFDPMSKGEHDIWIEQNKGMAVVESLANIGASFGLEMLLEPEVLAGMASGALRRAGKQALKELATLKGRKGVTAAQVAQKTAEAERLQQRALGAADAAVKLDIQLGALAAAGMAESTIEGIKQAYAVGKRRFDEGKTLMHPEFVEPAATAGLSGLMTLGTFKDVKAGLTLGKAAKEAGTTPEDIQAQEVTEDLPGPVFTKQAREKEALEGRRTQRQAQEVAQAQEAAAEASQVKESIEERGRQETRAQTAALEDLGWSVTEAQYLLTEDPESAQFFVERGIPKDRVPRAGDFVQDFGYLDKTPHPRALVSDMTGRSDLIRTWMEKEKTRQEEHMGLLAGAYPFRESDLAAPNVAYEDLQGRIAEYESTMAQLEEVKAAGQDVGRDATSAMLKAHGHSDTSVRLAFDTADTHGIDLGEGIEFIGEGEYSDVWRIGTATKGAWKGHDLVLRVNESGRPKATVVRDKHWMMLTIETRVGPSKPKLYGGKALEEGGRTYREVYDIIPETLDPVDVGKSDEQYRKDRIALQKEVMSDPEFEQLTSGVDADFNWHNSRYIQDPGGWDVVETATGKLQDRHETSEKAHEARTEAGKGYEVVPRKEGPRLIVSDFGAIFPQKGGTVARDTKKTGAAGSVDKLRQLGWAHEDAVLMSDKDKRQVILRGMAPDKAPAKLKVRLEEARTAPVSAGIEGQFSPAKGHSKQVPAYIQSIADIHGIRLTGRPLANLGVQEGTPGAFHDVYRLGEATKGKYAGRNLIIRVGKIPAHQVRPLLPEDPRGIEFVRDKPWMVDVLDTITMAGPGGPFLSKYEKWRLNVLRRMSADVMSQAETEELIKLHRQAQQSGDSTYDIMPETFAADALGITPDQFSDDYAQLLDEIGTDPDVKSGKLVAKDIRAGRSVNARYAPQPDGTHKLVVSDLGAVIPTKGSVARDEKLPITPQYASVEEAAKARKKAEVVARNEVRPAKRQEAAGPRRGALQKILARMGLDERKAVKDRYVELVKGATENFKKQGWTSIVDFRVDPNSPYSSLAYALRILRAPFEVSHMIGVKDGRVVIHQAFTSGEANRVDRGSPEYKEAERQMAEAHDRGEIDEWVTAHNHPGGEPKASLEDRRVVEGRIIDMEGRGYRGEVITDYREYGYIAPPTAEEVVPLKWHAEGLLEDVEGRSSFAEGKTWTYEIQEQGDDIYVMQKSRDPVKAVSEEPVTSSGFSSLDEAKQYVHGVDAGGDIKTGVQKFDTEIQRKLAPDDPLFVGEKTGLNDVKNMTEVVAYHKKNTEGLDVATLFYTSNAGVVRGVQLISIDNLRDASWIRRHVEESKARIGGGFVTLMHEPVGADSRSQYEDVARGLMQDNTVLDAVAVDEKMRSTPIFLEGAARKPAAPAKAAAEVRLEARQEKVPRLPSFEQWLTQKLGKAPTLDQLASETRFAAYLRLFGAGKQRDFSRRMLETAVAAMKAEQAVEGQKVKPEPAPVGRLEESPPKADPEAYIAWLEGEAQLARAKSRGGKIRRGKYKGQIFARPEAPEEGELLSRRADAHEAEIARVKRSGMAPDAKAVEYIREQLRAQYRSGTKYAQMFERVRNHEFPMPEWVWRRVAREAGITSEADARAIREGGDFASVTQEKLSIEERDRRRTLEKRRTALREEIDGLGRKISALKPGTSEAQAEFRRLSARRKDLAREINELESKLYAEPTKTPNLQQSILEAYQAEVRAGPLRTVRIPKLLKQYRAAGGKATPEQFHEAVKNLATASGGTILPHNSPGDPGVVEAAAAAGFKRERTGLHLGPLPFYLYIPEAGVAQEKVPLSERQAGIRGIAAPRMRPDQGPPIRPRVAPEHGPPGPFQITQEMLDEATEVYDAMETPELLQIRPKAKEALKNIGVNFRTELQSLPREMAIRELAWAKVLQDTKQLDRAKQGTTRTQMWLAARRAYKGDSRSALLAKMRPVDGKDGMITYLAWQEAAAETAHAEANYLANKTEANKQAWVEAMQESVGYAMFHLNKKGEFGRGLNAQKQLKQLDLDPTLSWLGRFRRSMKMQGIPEAAIKDMAVAYETGDLKRFEDLYRAILKPGILQKIVWMRNAGLVWGPATQFVNISSNLVLRGIMDFEKAIVATAIETGMARIPALWGKGRKRERTFSEIGAMWAGYKWALGIGTKSGVGPGAATHLVGQLHDILSALGRSAVLLEPKRVRKQKSQLISRESKAEFAVAPVGARTEAVFGAGYRTLAAFDDIFKAVSAGPELWRRRYRKALAEPLKVKKRLPSGKTITVERARTHEDSLRAASEDIAAMSDLMVDKGVTEETMERFGPDLEAVKKLADTDTLQEKLSPGLQKGQTAIRGSLFGSLLVPFYRTPVNIFKQAYIRSPPALLGLMLTKRGRALPRIEKTEALARAITGSLIGSVIAVLAYDAMDDEDDEGFAISGGGPTNWKQRANKIESGWAPYSIRFTKGGRWYDYSRLEPISTPIGFAADLAEAVHKEGGPGGMAEKFETEKERSEMIAELSNRLTYSLAENLFNKTFLMSLAGFFEATRPGAGNKMKSWLSSMETSFIPLSGATRALTRTIDPVFRKSSPWDVAKVAGHLTPFPTAIQSAIPGWSLSLPPRTTAGGEERRRRPPGVAAALSPVSVRASKPEAAAETEFDRLGYVPAAITDTMSRGAIKYHITQREQDQMNAARRESIRRIAAQLKTPQYHAMPDDEKDQPKYDDARARRRGKTRPPTKKSTLQKIIQNTEGKFRAMVLDRAEYREFLKRQRLRQAS